MLAFALHSAHTHHARSKNPLALPLTAANSRSREEIDQMGHAGRQPPDPSRLARTSHPAPAPPPRTPATLAARRPGTPRKAAQGTFCAACVCGSGNNARCQCKQDSRSQMHHGNEATSTTKGIVESDRQYELKMARYSGGTYAKPCPKTKPMPAEESTYSQHRKPYVRTVGSNGSQKRHCRRSVTPPPSSRRVSLLKSTSLAEEVPVLQAPIVEPALLNPTSVLRERPVKVYPDTRTAAPVTQEPSVKPVLLTSTRVYRVSSTECQKVPPKHSPQSIASVQHGALSQERNSEASISHDRSSGAPLILHTKLPKKHYQSEACWKGHFHVTGGLTDTCDGLEAHFPVQVSVRVYEASKRMPEILNIEAVPVSQLWPKKFNMVAPSSEDIGLWFVSSHQRPHWSFGNLLEKVDSYGLFTKIGDIELAVYSSKLLTPQDQRKNGKLYFWGVFGKRIRKKPWQNSNKKTVETSNPSQPIDSCKKYEEVGMKMDVKKGNEKEIAESDIDMTLDANEGNPTDVTGNRETVMDNNEAITKVLDLPGCGDADMVNDSTALLGTPNSNPASSCSVPATAFLNGCCHHDSAKNSTSILEDSACQPARRSLVTPPEFSPVPPGFTEAHRQLQTMPPEFSRVPPGFTEAHRQLQTETALILDIPPGFPTDIPPGFTEAHRGLPPAISTNEKKPFVRFSLNVPSPFKMRVPPGFSPLHAVKKEPGLSAVDETTNKGTVYSLASAAASVVIKPGKGDETKIQDSEVKIEQDETSEEREFPKIKQLSDLYRGPSDNTEISRNKGAGRHGNGDARCVCASIGGRAAMPTNGPLAASPGDEESISCRCVVCGEEFPAQ